MLLKDLVKECGAYAMHYRSPARKKNHTYASLYNEGIALKRNFIADSEADIIKDQIDAGLDVANGNNIWRDESGSDERIYGFEKIYPEILEIINVKELTEIGELYLGRKIKSFFVLAGRLSYKPNNLGSGGGWHRDSPFRHQFKSIIYLNNVDANNGPFEYVMESHKSLEKLKNITFSPLHQSRFKELNEKTSLKKRTFTGSKGDALLVDTKGVHRGAPIKERRRYAITFYFWEGSIPVHFSNSMNGNGVSL